MKNDFEVRSDHVAIFLDNTDGTRVETLINIEDFDKVNSIKGKWAARRVNLTAPYYVYGFVNITRNDGDQEMRNVALARYLLDFPKGLVVDHIDENTLDNRRVNLQAITNGQNVSKQMWRKKGRRKKDIIITRHIGSKVRDTDYQLIKQAAAKVGMSMEHWIAAVVSEKIGVTPWFREYAEDSAV